jgi:hypothetical protein
VASMIDSVIMRRWAISSGSACTASAAGALT